LPVLGYGVFGDGFQCCRWFEVDGVWLILSLIFGFVRWVSMGFGVGFRSFLVGLWFAVGCRVAHGGLRGGSRWWFPFLVDSGGFGVGFFFFFFFFFTPNTQCKIFVGLFSYNANKHWKNNHFP
jgi:hypothetical protein